MQKIAETKKRTALGQGLNALIPLDMPAEIKKGDQIILYVDIDSLEPNPNQPRTSFSTTSLQDLSNSIKELGVIQPLIARSTRSGDLELVAGERRWRAAKIAGLLQVPVIVRNVSDSESLEIALIENLQREDLNPMDTAEAYAILVEKYSYTHDVLAKRMGKDRTSVTNYLRLLKLPDPVKEHVRQEQLSMGHARSLLAIEHLPTQMSVAQKVVRRKLSVRELERIVQNYKNKSIEKNTKSRKDEPLRYLEKNLCSLFSTKVSVTKNNDNSGKIAIHFHSQEELERLLDCFGYSEDFS